MKKVIIGAIFAVCGAFIDGVILLGAAIYSQTMYEWIGTKLWYTIFTPDAYYQPNIGLNLGIPFVFGAILLLCGLVILSIECFRK